MSESLRNDGRIWVPKRLRMLRHCRLVQKGLIFLRKTATTTWSAVTQHSVTWFLVTWLLVQLRSVATRASVLTTQVLPYSSTLDCIKRLGIDVILQRYRNLFDMYEEITDVNPGELANEINGVKYYNPMMIFPAIHYTMGGIWVDYELMTTIPGLFAIGECNFSDHGANRLGASALMQGLADGYFVLPYTIQNYLADQALWPKLSLPISQSSQRQRQVFRRKSTA